MITLACDKIYNEIIRHRGDFTTSIIFTILYYLKLFINKFIYMHYYFFLRELFTNLFVFVHLRKYFFLKCRYRIHARFTINNFLIIAINKCNSERHQPFHACYEITKCQCFFNKLAAYVWSIAKYLMGNKELNFAKKSFNI